MEVESSKLELLRMEQHSSGLYVHRSSMLRPLGTQPLGLWATKSILGQPSQRCFTPGPMLCSGLKDKELPAGGAVSVATLSSLVSPRRHLFLQHSHVEGMLRLFP